jgi:coenzyme F420 hydrogenase subunit beta
MELDEYGEYRLNKHEYDSSLEKICAMSDISDNEDVIGKELFGATKGIKHNPVIGYYLNLYAGHVIEGDYRAKGSSGGFATWIFKELLINKHVDGVIHVKECSSEEALFNYDISTSVEEICNGSKTKYYPVEFSKAINTIRKLPGKYAIIGIPSFITEIRLLTKHDKVINKKIKYTLGLICGHQKSTKYTEAMAWQYGIKPGDLISINYRSKVKNKSSSNYSVELQGKINGKLITKKIGQTEFFVSNWGHGFFKTKFSDFTDDTMNETADISLGDAWLPEYVSDDRGTNILIVRNPIIQQIIDNGLRTGKIKLDELLVDDILRSQKGLIRHTREALPYRLYKRDIKGIWRPKKRLGANSHISLTRKVVQNIREDIAQQSHIIYREAVLKEDWSFFEKNMKKYINRYNIAYKLVRLQDAGFKDASRKLLSKLRLKFKS